MNLKKWIAIFLCCVSANQNAFAVESTLVSDNASAVNFPISSPTPSGLQGVAPDTSSSEIKNSEQKLQEKASSQNAIPQTTDQSVSDSDSSLDTAAPTTPEKSSHNSPAPVLIQPGPKLIAPANKTANVPAQEHEYYCTAALHDILLQKKTGKN